MKKFSVAISTDDCNLGHVIVDATDWCSALGKLDADLASQYSAHDLTYEAAVADAKEWGQYFSVIEIK